MPQRKRLAGVNRNKTSWFQRIKNKDKAKKREKQLN
eukprot:COSAG01_NODE_61152_length_291_cov_0.447917_1_plen_35_part_10